MQTYIIRTYSNELYCGKTNNIEKRIEQHKNEKKPHWFAWKNRKQFEIVLIINGDFEKFIKRSGIKQYLKSVQNIASAS